MPQSSSKALQIHPKYCWSLSPTYNTWVKLTVAGVHQLAEHKGFEGQTVRFYLNHPVRFVRVVGLIVTFEVFATRWIFEIDDGSGATIEVCCGRRPVEQPAGPGEIIKLENSEYVGHTRSGYDMDLRGFEVGDIVKVKGTLGEFRAVRQILLERIERIKCTEDEVVAWSETSAFYRKTLSKPWTPEERQVQKARRRAEKAERWSRNTQHKKSNKATPLPMNKTPVQCAADDEPVSDKEVELENPSCRRERTNPPGPLTPERSKAPLHTKSEDSVSAAQRHFAHKEAQPRKCLPPAQEPLSKNGVRPMRPDGLKDSHADTTCSDDASRTVYMGKNQRDKYNGRARRDDENRQRHKQLLEESEGFAELAERHFTNR